MFSVRNRFARAAAVCSLFAVTIPTSMMAQSHVVSPADLQKQAAEATDARQKNVQSLAESLSSEKVQRAMKAAKIDPAKVTTAVSSLSDADLAQLNSRAAKAQADFAAGRLSDRDLLIVLVAIAALILIIVAVH